MKNYRSLFEFTKGLRKGIFLLLALMFTALVLQFYAKQKSSDETFDDPRIEKFQKEIDSLKLVKLEDSKPKIYPFNPNFITDYKGYTLGMGNEEIDRLLEFRKQDKWINSAAQFQEVTKVSDSLLNSISPYFNFPDWVVNPRPKRNFSNLENDRPKSLAQKIDINLATASQLKRVRGIGEAYSKRIIEHRNSLDGGFASLVQLQEVYGLDSEVIGRIEEHFAVKTPANIETININKASRDELVTIKYIDYEVAYRIIEYRTLNEGFKSLDDLEKVKDFPFNKIDLIKLYLHL